MHAKDLRPSSLSFVIARALSCEQEAKSLVSWSLSLARALSWEQEAKSLVSWSLSLSLSFGSQGPCSARSVAATLQHFIPLWKWVYHENWRTELSSCSMVTLVWNEIFSGESQNRFHNCDHVDKRCGVASYPQKSEYLVWPDAVREDDRALTWT